jgi:hypothetical protein
MHKEVKVGMPRWRLAAGRGVAGRFLGSAARVTLNVERLMACCSVFAGPEDGAAPSLVLEYQKSRRRCIALGLRDVPLPSLHRVLPSRDRFGNEQP